MTFENQVALLIKSINNATSITAITGAGVSTDSGIPDFRGMNGLYESGLVPQEVLSISYFYQHPVQFYQYYRQYLLHEQAKPNATHFFFSELEKMGKLNTIITQNVDGLHQQAGSNQVIEIHGTIYKNQCPFCHVEYNLTRVKENYFCDCGKIIKPGILFYKERYDPIIRTQAEKALEQSDLLMIVGTSMSGISGITNFVQYYGSGKLIIINKEPITISFQERAFGDDITFERTPALAIWSELNKIISKIHIDSKQKVLTLKTK